MVNQLSDLILYHELGNDPVLKEIARSIRMILPPGELPGGLPRFSGPDMAEPMRQRTGPEGFGGGFPGQAPADFPGWGPGRMVPPEVILDHIHGAIRKLLTIATSYGFDKNLWQDYLVFLMMTDENSFSLTAEKQEMPEGSVKHFALHDMEIFVRLMTFDFSEVERLLRTDCFTVITHYTSVPKRAQNFNKNVSSRVREVSDSISDMLKTVEGEGEERIHAAAEKLLKVISDFYLHFGVGMFGLNRAFRLDEEKEGLIFLPINNTEEVRLSDLVGYEIQKQKLRDNTEAFLAGHRANNCLLFGDAGTGKSTSIKALITEYYDKGLRMIELYKHQMQKLSAVISEVKHRNYKFIIYMDDLSFEDFEVEYKYLKAVIEGGLENRPDNVLIYATSNRRHLIKETWNDTHDVDLEKHRGDTLQEKLSLVDRFGITIPYMKPNKKEFFAIVRELADRTPGITMGDEELFKEAQKWEMAHGGFSGRSAQQLINDLAGRQG